MNCPSCGTPASEGKYCGRCGTALFDTSNVNLLSKQQEKSNPVQIVETEDTSSISGRPESSNTQPDVVQVFPAVDPPPMTYRQFPAPDSAFGPHHPPGESASWGRSDAFGWSAQAPAGVPPAAGNPYPASGPAPGSRGRRKPVIAIFLVTAVVLAAVITTVVLVTGRSSTASNGATSDVESLPDPPQVAGQVDLRDLFEHSSPVSAANTKVLAVTDQLFVVSSLGSDRNSSETYEDVVAGIDRKTGSVVWKVSDKDLDPQGSADSDGFGCRLTGSGDNIICAQQEQSTNPDADRMVDLTVIKVADGTFTTSRAEGWAPTRLQGIGDDLLLNRSAGNSDYFVARVDPRTGKDKWTARTTFKANDFQGATAVAQFVAVPEVTATDTLVGSTILLDPETGNRIHELDGYVISNGTDFYSSMNLNQGTTVSTGSTPSASGVERVGVDGKIVWQNPDATLMSSTSYTAKSPVLGIEDGGTLVALSPIDGKELWRSDRKISSTYVADISNGRAFVAEGGGNTSGIIRIFDLAQGNQLGTANGSWVASSSQVFYTTDHNRLYGWASASGQNIWRVDYHTLSPRLSDDQAQIVTAGGHLFAIDSRTAGILN